MSQRRVPWRYPTHALVPFPLGPFSARNVVLVAPVEQRVGHRGRAIAQPDCAEQIDDHLFAQAVGVEPSPGGFEGHLASGEERRQDHLWAHGSPGERCLLETVCAPNVTSIAATALRT